MTNPSETHPSALPKDQLVQRFVARAAALRDQEPSASAEELAELALSATRRQPSYQDWPRTPRCPEEPMIDLMRRVMNGDGFLATTAGENRAAAAAAGPSRHPLFDRLGMLGIAPLPREIPDGDAAQVLLYNVKRNTVLTAVGERDGDALERDVTRLLRDVDRDRRSWDEEMWYQARD